MSQQMTDINCPFPVGIIIIMTTKLNEWYNNKYWRLLTVSITFFFGVKIEVLSKLLT